MRIKNKSKLGKYVAAIGASLFLTNLINPEPIGAKSNKVTSVQTPILSSSEQSRLNKKISLAFIKAIAKFRRAAKAMEDERSLIKKLSLEVAENLWTKGGALSNEKKSKLISELEKTVETGMKDAEVQILSENSNRALVSVRVITGRELESVLESEKPKPPEIDTAKLIKPSPLGSSVSGEISNITLPDFRFNHQTLETEIELPLGFSLTAGFDQFSVNSKFRNTEPLIHQSAKQGITAGQTLEVDGVTLTVDGIHSEEFFDFWTFADAGRKTLKLSYQGPNGIDFGTEQIIMETYFDGSWGAYGVIAAPVVSNGFSVDLWTLDKSTATPNSTDIAFQRLIVAKTEWESDIRGKTLYLVPSYVYGNFTFGLGGEVHIIGESLRIGGITQTSDEVYPLPKLSILYNKPGLDSSALWTPEHANINLKVTFGRRTIISGSFDREKLDKHLKFVEFKKTNTRMAIKRVIRDGRWTFLIGPRYEQDQVIVKTKTKHAKTPDVYFNPFGVEMVDDDLGISYTDKSIGVGLIAMTAIGKRMLLINTKWAGSINNSIGKGNSFSLGAAINGKVGSIGAGFDTGKRGDDKILTWYLKTYFKF